MPEKLRMYLRIASLSLLMAVSAAAQAPQPTSFSISPSIIYQGNCYTLQVGNSAHMTIDFQWRFNGGPVETTTGWPTLNYLGRYTICTASDEAVGLRQVVAVRNTLNTTWVPVHASVDVRRSDFTLNVSPSSRTVEAGESTTFTVSMTRLGTSQHSIWLGALNLPFGVSASFSRPYISYWQSSTLTLNVDRSAPTGNKTFVVRGSGGASTHDVTRTLVIQPPPQPTSFSISPTVVAQGDSYTLVVGNGANMTLDFQWRFNGGPVETTTGWPTLDSQGHVTIPTAVDEAIGLREVVAVRNTLNTAWVPVDASVTIVAPQPTSFDVKQSILNRTGGRYTLEVGSGAYMPIDLKYRVDNGAEQSSIDEVTLDANGQFVVMTGAGTTEFADALGKVRFTALRNSIQNDWVAVDEVVTVLDDCPENPRLPLQDRPCDAMAALALLKTSLVRIAPSQHEIHRGLSEKFLDYELESVDPRAMRRQLDETGRLSVRLRNAWYELVLEPNDLRSAARQKRTLAVPTSTFKGRVSGWPDSHARLTVDPELYAGYVRVGEERFFIDPVYEFVPGAGPDVVVVYQEADLPQGVGLSCGMTEMERYADHLLAQAPARAVNEKAAASLSRLEIATDVDAEYSILHHYNPALHIRNVLNMVEGYFMEGDLNLEFSVLDPPARTNPATDPYGSCHVSGLWCELRDEWKRHRQGVSRDVTLLFSGKQVFHDFSRTGLQLVRGAAVFRSTVCSDPDKAYVWVTNYRETGLTAHELGHALGAAHDDRIDPQCKPCGGSHACVDQASLACPDSDCLVHRCENPNDNGCQVLFCPDNDPQSGGPALCSSIQQPVTGFSACSQTAIGAHIEQNAACLAAH